MAAWIDYLENEGYEQLYQAKQYTDILSKDDPDDEPYKSLYLARQNLKAVKKVLKKTADKNELDDHKFVLAAIDLRLGVNFAECEENVAGEEHIGKCLQLMEPYKLTPRGMGIYHDALNQMGILWTRRRNPQKALEYFQDAELIYKEFKDKIGSAPWMVDEFLSKPYEDAEKLDFERTKQFESVYTHTLFYFAQVYGQLEEKELSARYCHMTLQRQLDSSELDHLDWCLHAATLSQFYMTEMDFSMCRHCLACAEVICDQAEANNQDWNEDKKEKLVQAKADIQRCWAKYGLGLLEASKEKLLKEAEQTDQRSETGSSDTWFDCQSESRSDSQSDVQTADEEIDENVQEDHEDKKKDEGAQKFNLEVTSHEEQITDKPTTVFDEAREVFLKVKKWLESAKDFYKIDIHCPDYVAITQDQSLSFKFLSFFELDMERQCKMHKRRIDMLSEILHELNPQHYLLIMRQLMFEIADTYSNILDLKLAIMEAAGNPTVHSMKKINTLAKESIKYYQEYLNTLKGGKPVYPDSFPENDIRAGLIAMFCSGRLNSKFIATDIQTRLLNIKKSKDCYQFVVDYCKRNPDAAKLVKTELEICDEMVILLPHKMEKIRRESEM